MRLRLLPILIAVAALTLVFRLDGLREGIVVWAQETPPAAPTNPLPTPAQADGQTAAESAAGAADGAADGSVQAPSEALAEQSAAAQQAGTDAADPAGPVSVAALGSDPFALTDSEIELLQALSERRADLDRREAELATRETLLTAAERRIEQKIAELQGLQEMIEDLLVQHDEQEAAQLQSLVTIYEAMKPKDAARIFEELEMPVLLDVIENMKERKTAPILAAMNPTKAKAVTLELAQRRELPIPRE